MRTALITALTACAEPRLQKKARRFLQGLSADELQYIADFLGACILESSERHGCGIACFNRFQSVPSGSSDDREHKMILLLEYLCLSHLSSPVRA